MDLFGLQRILDLEVLIWRGIGGGGEHGLLLEFLHFIKSIIDLIDHLAYKFVVFAFEYLNFPANYLNFRQLNI